MSFLPKNKKELRYLRYVARLWGIKPSYYDTEQKLIYSGPKGIVKLLQQLSECEVSDFKQLKRLGKQRRLKHYEQMLEPVIVFWENQTTSFAIYIQSDELKELAVRVKVITEQKHSFAAKYKSSDLKVCGIRKIDKVKYARLIIALKRPLPLGYHRILIDTGFRQVTSLAICAPTSLEQTTAIKRIKGSYGCFSPLYALRSPSDYGVGSFKELEAIQKWLGALNGHWFGSTPLLALDYEKKPLEISPYSPISRLFWNEIFLDIDRILEESPKSRAQSLACSPHFQHERTRLSKKTVVDYESAYLLKKQLLLLLAETFFEKQQDKNQSFRNFLQQNPDAKAYAKFRSSNKAELQYHLYVQFQLYEQLTRNAKLCKKQKMAGLYLDFPVGVARSGFDCDRYQNHFLQGTSAGAPPDDFFRGGQNWGFYPLHPHKIRSEGYSYFIESLRNHCRFTRLLRIDHVMGFHRIFAIPDGLTPRDGAYIRFHHEEFYAILLLEASRHKTCIVGEDLGTVPDSIRETMLHRGLKRMWVYQFECHAPPQQAIKQIPPHALACINTHDLVPFAGFWQGVDLQILAQHGFMTQRDRESAIKQRHSVATQWQRYLKESKQKSPSVFLHKLLILLSQRPVDLLQINLEDLWLETQPQNMPGTTSEYANWQNKLDLSIDDLINRKSIANLLIRLSKQRELSTLPLMGRKAR